MFVKLVKMLLGGKTRMLVFIHDDLPDGLLLPPHGPPSAGEHRELHCTASQRSTGQPGLKRTRSLGPSPGLREGSLPYEPRRRRRQATEVVSHCPPGMRRAEWQQRQQAEQAHEHGKR